jgi:hypothetical protein
MKESTKKLINEQIKKVLSELEQVEDVKDRVELRIDAIEMIYKVSGDNNIEMPQGKDSIRENKAKKQQVVVEEPEEEVEEVEDEPEFEEVSMEEVIQAGTNLEPDVAAQVASVIEGEEVKDLEEQQQEEVQEEEVQEEEEEVAEEQEEEVVIDVPEDIVEEFNMLANINNVSNEVVEHKVFVANWIHEDDLETVELYINYFASNIEEDENGDAMYIGEELHIDFLNDNNIAGFIDYINVLSE